MTTKVEKDRLFTLSILASNHATRYAFDELSLLVIARSKANHCRIEKDTIQTVHR